MLIILNPALYYNVNRHSWQEQLAKRTLTCFGANDGTISINGATGGYGTYQYTINGGASWQGSGIFTGLTPGTYNVRMRDALNPACMIILDPALVITRAGSTHCVHWQRTNVTCFGADDGTITITVRCRRLRNL